MRPIIKFVISDIHMGSQHDGLNEIIRTYKKKNSLFAKSLKAGGLVMFLNTQRTRAKVFSENGEVLAYLRTRDNRKLTKKTLDLIPAEFGGSFEYASAAKSALEKFLEIEREERIAANQ